ncbi:MAG TPA: hypothetical protein VL866_24155 [Pyrinomonadaceae bacterium]|nr:hypothetical protein [Pyrinomonadaceae bacterium]
MGEFLLNNIRQQIVVMQQIGKKPERLVCDTRSWDALVDELVPLLPMYPLTSGRPKIYGLEVEFSPEPNFEVK